MPASPRPSQPHGAASAPSPSPGGLTHGTAFHTEPPQFWPMTLDVNQNIQFHEPHPRGNIDFLATRLLRRRLNRTYGWTGPVKIFKSVTLMINISLIKVVQGLLLLPRFRTKITSSDHLLKSWAVHRRLYNRDLFQK